jgi:hypothetical protein
LHHYQLARLTSQDIREQVVDDLVVRLPDAEIDVHGAGQVRNDHWTIDGRAQRVIFAHPETSIRYRVSVPPDAALAFDIATAPASWEQAGDGVLYAIQLDSSARAMAPSSQPIFSVYIDPKSNPQARHWHPYTIDLSAYGGQSVTITLKTSAGPANDDRFDWAGWGVPRLLAP